VRLAIFVQLIVIGPVLTVWALVMEDVVEWLVEKPSIAEKAASYAHIIVIDYILQAASRTFMLIFHLVGYRYFDTNVDVCSTLLTLTAVAVYVGVDDSPSLTSIGWIQVAFGVSRVLVKVCYVWLKGWLHPYQKGLFGATTLCVRERRSL
jgi:Na+-driven multidrug efflux pump